MHLIANALAFVAEIPKVLEALTGGIWRGVEREVIMPGAVSDDRSRKMAEESSANSGANS